MKKVEWNKEHTWKILKKYVNGELESFRYQGIWYVPVTDYSGVEYDSNGESYLGQDCCGYCPLKRDCKAYNPIHNACEEFDRLCMRMEML